MAKRRTRKQKERAKHRFVFPVDEPDKIDSSQAVVKSQLKKAAKLKTTPIQYTKNAVKSAKDDSLAETKKEIIKSLALASLILASEIMIYLIWR